MAYLALGDLADPLLDERVDPPQNVETPQKFLLRLKHIEGLQAFFQLKQDVVDRSASA